jgi:hypothetical protein
MGLLLARDVARNAARVLNVLLTVENFPDRLWHWPLRIPQVNGEDEGVAARIVVENHFSRRIGKDAAIPIEFVIDTDGWKRRG